MSETLAIKADFERFDQWREAFARFDLTVVPWHEVGGRERVEYALVWKPGPGELAKLPGLRIIFSMGAGLDHLQGENLLPPGIPVVRMVDPGLTAGMVEYVLYAVLRFHRFMDRYEQHKAARQWEPILQVPAAGRSVGILGLGELGAAVAGALTGLGFRVLGWSRSEKHIEGVTAYHGDAQLETLLARSEILVCLLPLTDATRGILNASSFARMPRGAFIINAGRGGHQVEADIIEALDSGQLAGAALDVFESEPLPQDSPLWAHPGICFTPHVASMTLPATSAEHVFRNIERHRAGQPLTHVADMTRGY